MKRSNQPNPYATQYVDQNTAQGLSNMFTQSGGYMVGADMPTMEESAFRHSETIRDEKRKGMYYKPAHTFLNEV
ncbi:hypothetical protein [Vibrio harveyi]|uniref:hypothetical protein n=1 Tax=Vibrio harveyi TaxID=669 RepID=UPI00390AE404